MHTMTAVYNNVSDENTKYSRSLWDHPFQPKGSDKD